MNKPYGIVIYIISVIAVSCLVLVDFMNAKLKKVNNPISWSLIIAAIGLGSSALYSANNVENLALNNKAEIKLEHALRISETEELNEDIDELKDSVQDIYAKQETDNTEIKGLLYDILRQNLQPPVNNR